MAFARKGYAEANINQISLTAGVSKGTVYNYFPSKQALVLTLIAESGAAHAAFIAEQVQAVCDPAERLMRFYTAGFAFIEANPNRARFLLTTLYTPDAELQAAMFQAYQPMFNLVAQEILATGMAQGKVFIDARQVADFVLHALQKNTTP